MTNWKKILFIMAGFICAGLFVLAICVWTFISSLSSGYEITRGKVAFRSFNNMNWRVERREVQNADAESFETVSRSGGLYAKDANGVYFEGTSLSNADPSTFQVLDWRGKYSRDAHQAYWSSIPFTNDPDNLELLTRSYSRDSNNVYYASKVVEGADPASFVVDGTSTSHAHDKNHRYNMGRRVEE